MNNVIIIITIIITNVVILIAEVIVINFVIIIAIRVFVVLGVIILQLSAGHFCVHPIHFEKSILQILAGKFLAMCFQAVHSTAKLKSKKSG